MKNKNVFISHHHNDEVHIKNLKSLLEKSGYILRNSSIDSTRPNDANNHNYVKSLLSDGIRWAGTTIVLIGPKTHQSEYVDWEIEKSYKEGNRIVGVYINGGTNSDIPGEFLKHGDALVGWTGNRIIDAIEGRINNFENPDGTQTSVRWNQDREEC